MIDKVYTINGCTVTRIISDDTPQEKKEKISRDVCLTLAKMQERQRKIGDKT